MPPRDATDLLRLVASRENLAILSALTAGPEYPRRLAARLRRQETHVARRLRLLEEAGLVQGSWSRQDEKNIKLYRLKAKEFTVAIAEQGYEVKTTPSPGFPGGRPAPTERVPPAPPSSADVVS